MKLIFSLAAYFTVGIVFCQTQFTVTPPPGQTLDIVLTPFGMDNPVKTGGVDSSGKGFVNTDIDIGLIANTQPESYALTISEFFSFCANPEEMFKAVPYPDIYELSPYFLMKNDEVAGFLTIVSDTAIANRINAHESVNAVVGSYFEPVYSSGDFSYKGSCTDSGDGDGYDDLKTTYEIDITLAKGLNFLEFKIESLYETHGEAANSNAKKIMVTAHQELPGYAIVTANYY